MSRPQIEQLACAALLVLGACMGQDPFGLSHRRVAGDYELQRHESGSFYLRRADDDSSGGGVLEGTVERIAWTPDYIVAQRRALFGGRVDGWMVIEVSSHRVTGPLADSIIAARSALPRAADAVPAATAWDALGRR